MSTSPDDPHIDAFLMEIQTLMDRAIPSVAGSFTHLLPLLHQIRDLIVCAVQAGLTGHEPIPRPFQFDQPWLDTLQAHTRALHKRSTSDHALAALLTSLREQGVLEGPEPRIRLKTPRVLAISLLPQRLLQWNRIQAVWETVLLAALTRALPHKSSRERNEAIRHALNQAAWEAQLGLLIEGQLFPDRLGRALAFTKLSDFDYHAGFIILPTGLRRSKRSMPSSPRFASPLPLNLPAHALVLRYLLLRARWGRLIDEPLDFSNPDAFLFHDAIRAQPKYFHAWLTSLFPASPRPHITPPARGFLTTDRKGLQRPRIADIVDICRAQSIFDMWPILTADRSSLLASRPPTQDSWRQLIVPTSWTPAHNHAVPLAIPAHAPAYDEDATPPPQIEMEKILRVLDPCDMAIDSLLRHLATKIPRATRKALAAEVLTHIANAPPLLAPSCTLSELAPISNFILALKWLALMLDPPKVWPEKPLAPNTLRRYFRAVRRALIPATETLNLLSLTIADDSNDIVARALTADPTPGAKKNTKDGLVHFFKFLTWAYQIPALDTTDPALWLPTERTPYPLLLPHQADRLIGSLRPPQSIAAILASFVLCRRTEITGLDLKDLYHSCADLRLCIRRSKTRNGRRDAPLLALLPAHYLALVLEHWRHRWETVRHLPNPLDQPFLADESGNRFTDDDLGKTMNVAIKQFVGANYSLHSLRHGGASWLPLVWFVLCYGRPPASIGPDLTHPLFSDEHLRQVKRLLLGEFTGLPSIGRTWGTDFFHALSTTLMGHAKSSTTVDTYIHSLPLLQYYFLLRKPTNPRSPQVWTHLTMQHAANLLVCTDTEARTRLPPSQPKRRPQTFTVQTIVAAQRAALELVQSKQQTSDSPTQEGSNSLNLSPTTS